MKMNVVKILLMILSVGIIGCTDETSPYHIDPDLYVINQNVKNSKTKLPVAVISEEPNGTSSKFLVAGTVHDLLKFQWLNLGQDNSVEDNFIDSLVIQAPQQNIFVSTFNSYGTLESTHLVGTFSDLVHLSSVEKMKNGNYALYGQYKGTLTMGETTIESNNQSAFLAVFNGIELLWIKNIVATGEIFPGKLFVSGNDCYIAGDFSGEISFPNMLVSIVDPLTQVPGIKVQITQKISSLTNLSDGFFARYAATGIGTLSRVLAGTGEDHVQDIEVSEDAIYITGFFTDSTTLPYTTIDTIKFILPHSPHPLNTQVVMKERKISIEGRNGRDAVVARYSLSGEALWAKKIGGNELDEGIGLCLTHSSKLYVGGNFNSSSMKLASSTGDIELTNQGIQDVFRVYMNPDNGDVLSAGSIGGVKADYCTGVAHNRLGGAQYKEYIYGVFSNKLLIPDYYSLYNANQPSAPQGFIIGSKEGEMMRAYYCSDGYVPSGITERSFVAPSNGGAKAHNPLFTLGSLNSSKSTLFDAKEDEISSFNVQNPYVKSVLWEIGEQHTVDTSGDDDAPDVDSLPLP